MGEALKLVISYNMKPGKEEACHHYMVHKMAETLVEYGFHFTEAWYTAWGRGPQIMGCGLLDDVEDARNLLQSDVWNEVVAGLRPYVDDFSVRVVKPTGAFQL